MNMGSFYGLEKMLNVQNYTINDHFLCVNSLPAVRRRYSRNLGTTLSPIPVHMMLLAFYAASCLSETGVFSNVYVDIQQHCEKYPGWPRSLFVSLLPCVCLICSAGNGNIQGVAVEFAAMSKTQRKRQLPPIWTVDNCSWRFQKKK